MLDFRLVGVTVLWLAHLGPTIAEGQNAARTEIRIESLVAQYDSSWNRKDTVALGRLMAERYQYFTSRGAVRPRATWIEFVGSPEYTLEHAKRSEVVVTHAGPVAVVSSRWQGRGTYKGKRFVDDQRCGLVWIETAGRWQVLSEHCVQIAPDP